MNGITQNIVVLWFVFINIISSIFFIYDKNAAKSGNRRIPEKTLHLFEVFGGAFANLLLMYTLRHKNRKFSYFIWTWLFLFIWLGLLMIKF
jgi:uncharacterized membrane protein YsdA (DUF1294 family)